MPNHCHNDLWIDGTKEVVDAVLAFIGADASPPRVDFVAIVPTPFAERTADAETMSEEDFRAKHGVPLGCLGGDEYNWRCDNCGTKWGAYDVARRDYDGRVCVTFQTAWAPPLPVIAALHRRFPEAALSMEYFERGMPFAGGVTFQRKEYAEAGWEPGVPESEWKTDDYQGTRGG